MADPLPYQLQDARAAEQYAKWRLMELTSPSTQAHTHDHHSSSGEDFNTRPGAMLTYEASTSKFPVPDQNGPQLHHLQPSDPRRHGYTDSPTHPQGQVPQNSAGQMVSKHAPACRTVTDHQVHSVRMDVWDVSVQGTSVKFLQTYMLLSKALAAKTSQVYIVLDFYWPALYHCHGNRQYIIYVYAY